MDIKELRVGNIVKIDDEYLGPRKGEIASLNEKAEVELLLSVNKGNITFRRCDFRCGVDDIFPIPITEELATTRKRRICRGNEELDKWLDASNAERWQYCGIVT